MAGMRGCPSLPGPLPQVPGERSLLGTKLKDWTIWEGNGSGANGFVPGVQFQRSYPA